MKCICSFEKELAAMVGHPYVVNKNNTSEELKHTKFIGTLHFLITSRRNVLGRLCCFVSTECISKEFANLIGRYSTSRLIAVSFYGV